MDRDSDLLAGGLRTAVTSFALPDRGGSLQIGRKASLMLDLNDDVDPAESFQIKWQDNCVVVIPAANVEAMRWDLIEPAATIILEPLRAQNVPMVIFDLSQVGYFGSVFLALLLRCHKLVKSRGGELVLCGPSAMARELLRVTSLDTLWAIYDSREEALTALAV
jgi:anti-anti-sigma factor